MKVFYDFHLHSCLSPCGDEDMTPQNIVNMAKIMGFDAIALTDHNTCLNCTALYRAAKNAELTFIPGMELCTSEEVHIVCLFPELENALDFSDYIYDTLPPIKNKPSVFGEQLICDENDNIIGNVEKLLITASTVSAANAVEIVKKFGGICYPAHIDRSSFGIISNLGTIDETFGFTCAEIFDISKETELKNKYSHLNNLKILSSSDAHYLENIRLPEHFAEPDENTPKSILDFLGSPTETIREKSP